MAGTQVLVKAAFPLTVTAPYATYEIPFGAIQRSTTAKTPQDRAKWEVPALRWADLSQADRGVSLLTDYKHGFDATPSQLRLTLLKAPLWPDPGADRGVQTFTYAIYPHAGSWQAAKTVQMARNFNLPIQPCLLSPEQPRQAVGQVTATASYLDLGDTTLVLSAFKLAEDSDNTFILRGYESTGKITAVAFNSCLPLKIVEAVDILEQANRGLPTPGTQPCPQRLRPGR
ncbi:MAG: hypothetical protein HC929_06400 [Leptolyngbyaceae cyanobacterium SM2_5_2]|nr:hypothetical protein [Leptolyngbyaceae cyanobacterium SM2_5_2]